MSKWSPREMLIAHSVFTWCLVGLIWTIQVVHYPLFPKVGREQFRTYHESHMLLVTLLVGPLVVGESTSAAWMLWKGLRSLAFLCSLPLMIICWTSTFLLQVPHHAKLSQGFDENAYRGLLKTNWIRTICWSLRGLLTASLLWH
jgi:hypothetical protein